MADAPVQQIPSDEGKAGPAPGIGLCLSGGGYRAMMFHAGVIWRLYESGVLRKVDRISSVSGGSITSGMLALKWRELSFDPAKLKNDFVPKVIAPLRGLADETLDVEAVLIGLFLPGSISDRVVAAYKKHLYGDATLQDLPDAPRFIYNATNIQTGVLWRFSKPYMRDYLVGEVKNPTVPLAKAIAASSAFPPVLSPVELRVDPKSFTPNSGTLQKKPFNSKVMLGDGGIYDNLGLETVWKRYQTVLVSDAGTKLEVEEEPKSDWARHSFRVLSLIDSQVRALRKRQVIGSYTAPPADANHRKGAYWGIRADIANYQLPNTLPCPHDRTLELAATPTRLERMDDELQERLINWGYAVSDAALRKHVNPAIAASTAFPYPAAGV
jgi:NTE family protein